MNYVAYAQVSCLFVMTWDVLQHIYRTSYATGASGLIMM